MKNDTYYDELIKEKQKQLVIKISKLRTKNNLSAKELSLRIGMSASYINRLESEGFMPSMEAIIKIVDVCGCTLEEFFYEDQEKYALDIELAKTFENLSQDKKFALLSFLKAE